MGHDAVRYARCDTRLEKRIHGEKETLRPEQEFREKAFIGHPLLLIGVAPRALNSLAEPSCPAEMEDAGAIHQSKLHPLTVSQLPRLPNFSVYCDIRRMPLQHCLCLYTATTGTLSWGRHQPTSLVLYRCHVACFCGRVLLLPVESSEGPSRLA